MKVTQLGKFWIEGKIKGLNEDIRRVEKNLSEVNPNGFYAQSHEEYLKCLNEMKQVAERHLANKNQQP